MTAQAFDDFVGEGIYLAVNRYAPGLLEAAADLIEGGESVEAVIQATRLKCGDRIFMASAIEDAIRYQQKLKEKG